MRVKLRLARAETLKTIETLAKGNGASHILLAGDTFDQTAPLLSIVRQAMIAMGAALDLVWILMPGNHDHVNATALWCQVTQDAPSNVSVVLTAAHCSLDDSAVLLPVPSGEGHLHNSLID